VVGFGVQGTKTQTWSPGGSASARVPAAGSVMKHKDHRPGPGHSMSPTWRKLWPSCLNTVSKICLTPL
jgi:hypothetical protein